MKLSKTHFIYPDEETLFTEFTAWFYKIISNLIEIKDIVNIAISGGSTPKAFFEKLNACYGEQISWEKVHVFWTDERCVPPDDNESNFKMTHEALLSHISIPAKNIHRMRGEENPLLEAKRYAMEIKEYVPLQNNIPHFDIILLGMGTDGHTASIFPGNETLFSSNSWVEAVRKPENNQMRITLTGKILNNAHIVAFLVSGAQKAKIVAQIFNSKKSVKELPASFVLPNHQMAYWFMDRAAAEMI